MYFIIYLFIIFSYLFFTFVIIYLTRLICSVSVLYDAGRNTEKHAFFCESVYNNTRTRDFDVIRKALGNVAM